MKLRAAYIVAAAVAFITVPASAARKAGEPSDSTNTLTHGMVQLNVRVGTTTQAEILEAFGGPNITTIDGSGREVWVYDRHATIAASSASNFSIGMLVGGGGGGVGGGAGVGFGKNKAKSEQSTRSMTLIIKFDETKKVADFRSRSSSF